MNMAQLLFDDEGVISRRLWWLGTITLVLAHIAAGYAATRWLGARGLDRPAMLFLSIAILIPFYAVNAKRFRAIGRDPALALVGGALPALAALKGMHIAWPMIDIALGGLIIATIVWYAIDLGLYDHEAHASAGRIDAALRQP
jgi:uncharacterized membrane protein YhaH (DUF805 family)